MAPTQDEKLAAWKKQFHADRKKSRKGFWVRLSIFLVITLSAIYTTYAWFTDELQFWGHNTDYTTATVVNTRWNHFVNNDYLQLVTYEFDYQDSTYSGSFQVGRTLGRQSIGTTVKVKFSTDDPSRSKMIRILKRNYPKQNWNFEAQ